MMPKIPIQCSIDGWKSHDCLLVRCYGERGYEVTNLAVEFVLPLVHRSTSHDHLHRFGTHAAGLSSLALSANSAAQHKTNSSRYAHFNYDSKPARIEA